MRHENDCSALGPFPLRRLRFALLTMLTLSLPAPAGAALYWVGNGGAPPCTHATLAAAIATAQANATDDVILIVGNPVLSGPFTINGGGLQITGGADACGSANVSGPAALTAPLGSRPLTIDVGAAGGDVTLYNLYVSNQNLAFNGDGGAVSFTAANPASRLVLVKTFVRESTALGDGGGLLVSGGIAEIGSGSLVYQNSAANGGGVAVRNDGVLELAGGSVQDNVAFLHGGGVYVAQGEVRSLVSSSAFGNFISSNLAGGNGGGIFLETTGVGLLSGSATGPPLYLIGNQATLGGGAYVESLAVGGGGLRLEWVLIGFNQAAAGGGAYLSFSSKVYSALPAGEAGDRYPIIQANQAGAGSAFYVHGGNLDLYNARIFGHQEAGADTSLIAADADAIVRLSGAEISRNQCTALIALDDSAVTLDFSSIAANTTGGLVAQAGAQAQLTLRRTLVEEAEPLYESFDAGAPPPVIACLVSRFTSPFSTLPPGTDTSQLFFGNPAFFDPTAGNLHIRSVSAAVDRCSGGGTPGNDRDAEARGFDDPRHPNPAGRTFDAGADELVPIFWDDLELGNLSRWSQVVGLLPR